VRQVRPAIRSAFRESIKGDPEEPLLAAPDTRRIRTPGKGHTLHSMRSYEKARFDTAAGQPLPAPLPMRGSHPETDQVERFLRGELTQPEVRTVVRHLLTRCPQCIGVAGRLWSLGNPAPLGGDHD
jgi:hypothetical protein